MVTEDFLNFHIIKNPKMLKKTSDNGLLPKNKDSCFGDYKADARFKKPREF
jgi:hypothetical protein